MVASGSEPEPTPWSAAATLLLAPSHDWRALLAAMMHWQCELFVLSRAGPYGASGGLPTIPLSRRASWTALAWYACALRSSNRPAYRARAWLRRQLPLKCDGRRWRYRARSRSRRLGARRRPLAPSHIFCAPLVAAVHWRRELFARPGAGPYETSNGLPATPLSRRDSSTVLA